MATKKSPVVETKTIEPEPEVQVKSGARSVETTQDTSQEPKKGLDLRNNSLAREIAAKQPMLVSGTNIKTINGQSLLGSGNLAVDGHFKGWYDSASNLPADPVVGDYAYVKGATADDPAAIYECTTAGTWSDSGRTADTSNVQTFASGEEVNETYIDNTHLVNPADGALPTAADVLQLKAKLDGVTAEETKATNYTLQAGVLNADTKEFIGTAGASRYTVIPVGDAKRVRFLGVSYGTNNTAYNYGFGFYNAANEIFWTQKYEGRNDSGDNVTKEYVVDIPEGAVSLICSVILASNTLNESNFYCYLQSGKTATDLIDDVNTEIDAIGKITSPCVFEYVQGLYITTDGKIKSSTSSIKSSYQIAYTKVRKGDIINLIGIPSLLKRDSNDGASLRVVFTYNIPYSNVETYDFHTYNDGVRIANMHEVRGILTAPIDGYFCVYYLINYLIQIYDINYSTITTVKKDNQIGVCQGRVLNGYPDGDRKYVTSDYIKGGVYFDLVCRDGYKINSVNLYDDSGKLVCANFFGESAYTNIRFRNRNGWGSMLPPHIMARVTIVKNSEGCTADEDCLVEDRPIKSLRYLKESNGYRLEIPQSFENVYPFVKYRALTLVNCVSKYLRQTPNYFADNTGLNIGNNYYNLSNRQYYGVSYSDNRLRPTTVGNDVSMYTYITALAHKYSVVYTENLYNNKTSYGNTYPAGSNGLAIQYYNMACDMFFAYCLGLYALRGVSNDYTAYTAIYNGGITSGMISDYVQPCDALSHKGHIALVLDVVKHGNNIEYIVVSESSTPLTRIIVYPKDDFNTYYMSNFGTVENPDYYSVYRKNQIDINTYYQPFDTDNGDYVEHNIYDYPYIGSEKECMLYVGDRASLSAENPVFVNVNRNTDKYTKVNVYKNDTLLQSVDITSLSAWEDDPDGEDWVKVDLTSVVDGYGKYKAQASNADDSKTSNETVWEIIDVELSVSGDTANFSVSGGVPYMLQEEQKSSGYLKDGQCDLLDPSDTSHDISDYTKSTSAFDLALYAMGDYGMVKKIVSRN